MSVRIESRLLFAPLYFFRYILDGVANQSVTWRFRTEELDVEASLALWNCEIAGFTVINVVAPESLHFKLGSGGTVALAAWIENTIDPFLQIGQRAAVEYARIMSEPSVCEVPGSSRIWHAQDTIF